MKLNLVANGIYKMEQSEKPTIKEGESLVKVKASGICGSDIPRVFQKTYHYPLVVGHEFCGVIEDSYDKGKIGKNVCIFPIKPCFNCDSCKEQNYANCVGYDYYGSRCDGGMQDYIVAKDFNLIELPNNISFHAGAMVEPTAVCLHAVKKVDLNGKVLKVYGAGTIGLLCCMIAKVRGAKEIIVFDVDENKMKLAKSLGFMESGETPDVIIDASGAMPAVTSAIKEIKPFGEIIFLGNAHKDMNFSLDTYSQILRKQLTIKGSWNSDFKDTVNDWKDAIDMISKGEICPEKLITHVYKLQDADKAFDMIKEKKETFNKVMVEM
ncbi:MAG: galactitol-1-phosphate 5-dehydrogenase [Clostridia bacterium]|nr:galactitol-1-phosphate 5-dehydrogenase [Clostridia bacterium]